MESISRSPRSSMRRPSNQTSPRSGLSSPTMCLSMTLLPLPLAPMTTTDCPSSMPSETPFSTTSRPKRLWTLRSSMRDMGGECRMMNAECRIRTRTAAVPPRLLFCIHHSAFCIPLFEQPPRAVHRGVGGVQDVGEEEVEDDDREEAGDEALGAGAADAAGAAAAGEALVAADQPDRPAEEHALDQPLHHLPGVHALRGVKPVRLVGHAQERDRNQPPAQHA